MGWPCWRSCITYPAVLLARAAFRAATKPSVLKDSVTPAGILRRANFVIPSSSPRELMTPMCMQRLHDMGGGGEAVKDEAAG